MKDFSIYVNSAEKLEQIKNRKRFYRKYRLCLAVLTIVLLCGAAAAYQLREFHSFDRIKTVVEEYSSDQRIEVYRDGVLKYGENQITYYDKEGDKVWSKTHSISNPQIKTSENYVLAADLQGKNVYVYTDKGETSTITTSYDILDAEVSDQGVVAIALSAKNTNYIELYNLDGDKLVSIQTSIGENGYPLDIALSPDGQTLCASYFIVDGVEMKNRLTFYDFSEEGEKTENIMGGFDFDNTLVPTVAFIGSDTVCAFGDDRLCVYRVTNKPRLQKEVAINSTIKSIAYDDEHMAIVRGHYSDEEEGNYTLDIFSRNGNLVGQCGVDGDYTEMNLRKGKVIFTSPYHCAVYTSNGNNIFDHNFTKHVLQLLPGEDSQKYFIEYDDRLDLIRLQ